jgi:hypothetical protein
MFQDWGMYNNLSRFVLMVTMMAFVAILVFDMYLLIFNAKAMYQMKNSVGFQVSKVAKMSLDYGDGQKRFFEGEVTSGSLTLIDVLTSISEVGGVDVVFQEKNGAYVVQSIDDLQNSGEHYWELSLPLLNWSKKLEEIDARQSIFIGGTKAILTYR